jgi:hypothetical protein
LRTLRVCRASGCARSRRAPPPIGHAQKGRGCRAAVPTRNLGRGPRAAEVLIVRPRRRTGAPGRRAGRIRAGLAALYSLWRGNSGRAAGAFPRIGALCSLPAARRSRSDARSTRRLLSSMWNSDGRAPAPRQRHCRLRNELSLVPQSLIIIPSGAAPTTRAAGRADRARPAACRWSRE